MRFPSVFHFSICTFVLIATSGAISLNGQELPAKVTYDDHVKPIFREHCLSCHNANDKKSGLALDSYQAAMEGGAGGEALVAADLDSSRVWALTAHVEEPKMPPNQDRIASAKLDILKRWIEQGMPENSGSAIAAPKVDLTQMGEVSLARPSGPPPMPTSVLTQTPLFTPRAAATAALCASPWSPLIAVGGQEQVALYHSDSGALLGILPFPEGEPQSITFSRDGKLILVGGGRHSHSGYAVLYEIESGKRITRVGEELDIVMAADISDDNSKIALAGPQRMVRVYDTATGELVHDLKKHTDWIYAVRFSPDGLLLASADRSNGLVVWETDTGNMYLDLVGHKNEIRTLAWRPDSMALLSGSLDNSIKLWDMNVGKLIKSWDAHGGGVFGIAVCNDGTIASTGKDKKVKLWKSNGDPIADLANLPDAGLEVAISVDAKSIAAGDWAGNVLLWNRADAKQAKSIPSNPETLEMRLKRTEEQIAKLSEEVRQANEKLVQPKQDLAAAEASLKQQQDRLVASQKSAEEKSNQLSAKSSRIEGLSQSVAHAQAAVEANRQKLQELLDKLAIAKSKSEETKELGDQVAAQQASLAQLQATLEKVRSDEMSAKSELAVAKSWTEDATRSIESAKAKVAEAQKVVDAKLAALNESNKVVVAAEARLKLANDDRTKVQDDLKKYLSTIKGWDEQIDSMAKQRLAIEQAKVATQSSLDAQKSVMNDLNSKTASLRSEIEKLQAALTAVEKQLQDGAKVIADKESQLKSHEQKVGVLEYEWNQLKSLRSSYPALESISAQ